MNIEEIKKSSPAYANMSDGDLAFRLWNKQYKDKIPMGVFADKIGLSQDGFKGMIATSKASGYEPTGQAQSADHPAEKHR